MTETPLPANPTEQAPTIFDLLQAYHRSLENMRGWLAEVTLSELERIALADAWQEEMRAWFRENGYCFGCNREISRCHCA
jgi:hypothetical protein